MFVLRRAVFGTFSRLRIHKDPRSYELSQGMAKQPWQETVMAEMFGASSHPVSHSHKVMEGLVLNIPQGHLMHVIALGFFRFPVCILLLKVFPRNNLLNCIQKHIKKIIHHGHVGFSISRSIKVIHCLYGIKDKNHVIISLDTEKAFG